MFVQSSVHSVAVNVPSPAVPFSGQPVSLTPTVTPPSSVTASFAALAPGEIISPIGPAIVPQSNFRGEGTVRVGSSDAVGPYGTQDTAGNVREWCLDWYGAYPGGAVSDPTGSASGSGRVIRGGDWSIFGRFCRSAFRNRNFSLVAYNYVGFRVVLAPVQP